MRASRSYALTFRRLDDSVGRAMQQQYPDNPFCTLAYAEALTAAGKEVSALVQTAGEAKQSLCVATQERTGLGRLVMEVPSLTPPVEPDTFWEGLESCCRARGVNQLLLRSFGTTTVQIPPRETETLRVARTEWTISLSGGEFASSFSSHHRRQIRRAERAGLKLQTTGAADEAAGHTELVASGQRRRAKAGKSAAAGGTDPLVRALLAQGAATLYQAFLDDAPVGSVLVLESATTGYYYSAGVSDTGYRAGASHWLVAQICRHLAEAGKSTFNLGGTRPEQEGLVRFKAGFNTTARPLLAVNWSLSISPGRRVAQALAHLARRLGSR